MNLTESEFQSCFMCGDECESKEKEAEMVRCACCLREESKIRGERFLNGDENERKEIA